MTRPRSARHGVAVALVGLAVVGLAASISLVGLSRQPFYTKGEPREAMVVWEMAHGGGLVLPLRNGTEIPSKPPFFHWLGLAVSEVAGGVSEVTTRLPSALLSIAAVLAVYLFGATTGRIRSGWIAATALMLSFEWLRAARIARVDMTLTAFLVGALLLFAVMDLRGVTRLRRLAFYACLAAATLGKGPVGVAVPALVIVLYAAVRPADAGGAGGGGRERLRRVVATLRPLHPVAGLAAVAAVAGAWYAAALWIGGDSFFVKQVLKENVFRVIDSERFESGHAHGPLYMLPNFLLGALPWSLVAPAVAWWLWRMRPVDATTRYLVVWFSTVLVFFSLSSSKRSVYILPAYPAAALLLGRVLGPGPEGEGPRRLAAIGLIVGAAAVLLVGVAGLVIASGAPVAGWIGPLLEPHDRQGLAAAAAALASHAWLIAAAAGLAIAGSAGAIAAAPGAHWLRASVSLTVAMVALYGGIAAPVERGIAESRTLGPFMAAVRHEVGEAPLAFLCTFDYGAVFYSQRYFPAPDAGDRCAVDTTGNTRCRDHVLELLDEERCRQPGARLAALRDPRAPRYVLLWENEVGELEPALEVLLRSEGTGPKGRARMLLATRRR